MGVFVFYPEILDFRFYPLKFYLFALTSPLSIFYVKYYINLSCMFSSSNKMMPHNFYYAMHWKFVWHLTENRDEGTDANEIEFQGVKSKFWNFNE